MSTNLCIYREPPHVAISLYENEWGQLVLVREGGEEVVGVQPVRAFPLSDPRGWVVITAADGRELATIEDPSQLADETRDRLERALAQRDFVPCILRITYCSGILEPCEWEVETDRGKTRLVLKNEDDIHRLGRHRALVIDAEGMRYLIPDSRNMDAASRKVLDRYL